MKSNDVFFKMCQIIDAIVCISILVLVSPFALAIIILLSPLLLLEKANDWYQNECRIRNTKTF